MPTKLSTLKLGTLAWYKEAFDTMTYDKGTEPRIKAAAKKVAAGMDRYKAVGDEFGIPWYWIGCTHMMEASCDWKAILHNGQKIIGTGKKSTIVPIGVGPFSSWEQAARDAIKREGMDKVKDWSFASILKQSEAFNGLGYQRKGRVSPYVFSCTSICPDQGKYVSDGKFSSTADANAQVGVAAILKELQAMGLTDGRKAPVVEAEAPKASKQDWKDLQTAANKHGATLVVDGIPGKATKAALVAIAGSI